MGLRHHPGLRPRHPSRRAPSPKPASPITQAGKPRHPDPHHPPRPTTGTAQADGPRHPSRRPTRPRRHHASPPPRRSWTGPRARSRPHRRDGGLSYRVSVAVLFSGAGRARRIAPATPLPALDGMENLERSDTSIGLWGYMGNDLNSAATSPDAKAHPGVVTFENFMTGESHRRLATDIPQSVGWHLSGEDWVPVVHVVIAGDDHRREITSYGPDGQPLERTYSVVQPPSRRRRRRSRVERRPPPPPLEPD